MLNTKDGVTTVHSAENFFYVFAKMPYQWNNIEKPMKTFPKKKKIIPVVFRTCKDTKLESALIRQKVNKHERRKRIYEKSIKLTFPCLFFSSLCFYFLLIFLWSAALLDKWEKRALNNVIKNELK